MNAARVTAIVALSGLLGCGSGPTQPAGPQDLWQTQGLPSGAYIVLHLSIQHGIMSGTAEQFGLQSVPLGDFMLTGRQTGDQFNLTLTSTFRSPAGGPMGPKGHFIGSFTSADVMVGVWDDGVRAPFTETFYLYPTK